MAHNRSPSKLRADALAVPLNIYRGWLLEVDCGGGCPRGRVYRVEALARAHGSRTVGDVVQRFRCQACGAGAVTVVLVERSNGAECRCEDRNAGIEQVAVTRPDGPFSPLTPLRCP